MCALLLSGCKLSLLQVAARLDAIILKQLRSLLQLGGCCGTSLLVQRLLLLLLLLLPGLVLSL
jgi:hypothetical protein